MKSRLKILEVHKKTKTARWYLIFDQRLIKGSAWRDNEGGILELVTWRQRVIPVELANKKKRDERKSKMVQGRICESWAHLKKCNAWDEHNMHKKVHTTRCARERIELT